MKKTAKELKLGDKVSFLQHGWTVYAVNEAKRGPGIRPVDVFVVQLGPKDSIEKGIHGTDAVVLPDYEFGIVT